MFRLSHLILFLLFSVIGLAQSPHTNALKTDCADCHNPSDWNVNPLQVKFDHSQTDFNLTGQHLSADCKSCHSSLIFSEVPSQCISCHQDIHQNTAGPDCQKCHAPDSWTVTGIKQIHDESRFPLIGVHKDADCIQCHSGYQNLYFEPLSVDCFSCHQSDYNSTTSPNHASAGFSTECQDCHNIVSETWAAENFIHDFFPLTGGHNIPDCFSCHSRDRYTGLSSLCYSCHRNDFEQVQDPNHVAGNYPTECSLCHSINGWKPADFNHNNTQFPLTGAHLNADCSSCHSQSYSGTSAICVDCHSNNYNAALNPSHTASGISSDCGTCHSTAAWVPSSFSHISTGFELIGEHSALDCSSCHEGTTSGLIQECVSCHQDDFNASTNPNHSALSLSTQCQTCHTPTQNWEPASFSVHNNYYELIGAHAAIANDCATCHNGNYISTPNTCYGCHQQDYTGTTDPAHAAAGFSTDCINCHNQNAWTPSTFDHDNQYFPIYTGKHKDKWNLCSDCHTNSSDFGSFSCIGCHEHEQTKMDEEHSGISGYSYNSDACYSCHPSGDSDGAFNHSLSDFPLTGAHITTDCQQCHKQGYTGTSTGCVDCHQSVYSSASNPDHQALSLSLNCGDCHSTGPGWEPALFPQHNQYFEFTGAHIQISNDCNNCHSGNYVSTSPQCSGCHQDSYTTTQNPDHSAIGISTDCRTCHSTTAWIPSTFSHASTGFELTGQHMSIQCSACHVNTNSLNAQCISCHQENFNIAPDHAAQSYPLACEMCHNAVQWSQVSFDHQNTQFPLTGSHLNTNCSDCHSQGFEGTTTTCSECHQPDYNTSVNPSHSALALPAACENCHTTNQDWKPALFPDHNNYYQLLGAHALIAGDCAGCHNGDYNNTSVICYNCHKSEYDLSVNPPHLTAAFPHECESCHTQTAWIPSTFDHDNQYFPIYSGNHREKWDECADCHTGQTNYSVFSCINCHEHNQTSTDEHHQGIAGYVYDSIACYDCHPDGGERSIMRFRLKVID